MAGSTGESAVLGEGGRQSPGQIPSEDILPREPEGGDPPCGSGNLSMQGLEEGKEVFSRFDSSDREGLGAILSWREWMSDIIEQTGDELLGQRWFRLRQTTKEWLKGRSKSSAFVTNVESSLLDQLLATVSNADAIHVTAPFFDRDVEALGELINRARPKDISVYLGRRASVDGAALARLLKRVGRRCRCTHLTRRGSSMRS